MKRPNILYLHTHDAGRYVQPYGHAIPTANMQRLAEQGVLFRQAFCVSPTCSPSRASLLSGELPHNNGMIGLASLGYSLIDDKHHLTHTLRTARYHSALSGVQHVARDPNEIGYDEILTTKPRDAAQMAERFLADSPSQPFFLSVGFNDTHRKFAEPGPDEDPRYCLPPPVLPDTPQTRADMAAYKASARLLDEKMGAVLEALDANGLVENTLVMCTTDHGIAFPAMKCNLTDHGIGVMLIMRGPGGFERGKVVDAMVSHLDIFPTICEMLDIDPPPWLQGQSLLPLIRGETDEIHDEIFAEINYHDAYEPQRCVRTKRWKYIRRFDNRNKPVMPNCDNGRSKDFWIEHGWRERVVAEEQLYDLIFDPNETHNVAGDPAMKSVLDDMRIRLERHMKATNDPLSSGYIAAPQGAIMTDLDDVSELTGETIRRLRAAQA